MVTEQKTNTKTHIYRTFKKIQKTKNVYTVLRCTVDWTYKETPETYSVMKLKHSILYKRCNESVSFHMLYKSA